MTNPKRIAIITGASVGIGAEFAKQVDAEFSLDEIWLVARREEALKKVASGLKTKAVLLSLDLAQPSSWETLRSKLASEKPALQLLINNAGLGKQSGFATQSEADIHQMLDLNIAALTLISRICIPYMPQGSSLVQVASSIAFSPTPGLAIYAATKSFVLSFSHALRAELKPRGIHVLAVCPGPVKTEFFHVATNRPTSENLEPLLSLGQRLLLDTPEHVASCALKDLRKRKDISISHPFIRIFAWIAKFVPLWLLMKVTSRSVSV